MNKRGVLGWILFFLVAIAIGTLAFLYLSPSSPRNFVLNQSTSEIPSYNGSLQFYPNMRFPGKTLSYNIDSICSQEKHDRMIQAFSRLENETLLKFSLSLNPVSDIFITCKESQVPENQETFIAGEGGAKTIIRTERFNIIEQGEILLLYQESCNSYNVELHELLHVLGFTHSNNPKSLMYNTSDCSQRLTQDILDEINKLYSIDELPDLYLTNVSAIKHSNFMISYIDFSLDVKNQGLKEAREVKLEVYSSSSKVDEFSLGKIGYGEGKYFQAKNIKFSGDKVSFLVKSAEADLNLENNRADLAISG